MPFARIAATAVVLVLAAGTVQAQVSCLSPAERRTAVAGGQALPLEQAQRSLRGDHRGEVINARLCRAGPQLVYLLTVVARHGKVMRVRIDAKTGQVVQVR
jgi:uncharacterized membrane protein YkoI